MQEALGMVETKGLVAMIEAADAMVKAANDRTAARNARLRALPLNEKPQTTISAITIPTANHFSPSCNNIDQSHSLRNGNRCVVAS